MDGIVLAYTSTLVRAARRLCISYWGFYELRFHFSGLYSRVTVWALDAPERQPFQGWPHVEPVRILHTESSTQLGGQEFRTLREAEGMIQRGHSVLLAVPPGSRLLQLADRCHIPVAPVRFSKSRYGPLVVECAHLIRDHGIQVVNTHNSVDSWTGGIAARWSRKKPVVVRTRHRSTPVSNTVRHRVLYKTLPDAVVTTGEAVRQHLVKQLSIPESTIVSIPTGVDLGRFYPARRSGTFRAQWGISSQHVLIGTVAFLRNYKGLDDFVDAAAVVMRRHPEARFLIVGDGPEEMRLRRKIHERGVTTRVLLTGFQEDIPTILMDLDLFVLASIGGEGLPQSVTQAMAMERPVIATSVGSVGEVVRDEVTGLLVSPRAPAELAGAIDRLIGDPALRDRFGKAGRELIASHYTFQQMLDRTEALYDRLLAMEPAAHAV